jgi:hypothetical protein
LKRHHADVLCHSATTPQAAAATSQLYQELATQFRGMLAYGGQAYNEHPETVAATPGTYLGKDANVAVEAIQALLPFAALRARNVWVTLQDS